MATRLDDMTVTSRLPAALRWQEETTAEVVAEAARLHATDLENRLKELLPMLRRDDLVLLSDLGDRGWSRLLLAPSMGRLLRAGQHHAAAHLVSGVIAETVLAATGKEESLLRLHARSGGGTLQTALGDHRWTIAEAQTRRHHSSPRVQGVVVDCSRRYAAAGLRMLDESGQIEDHDSNEIQHILGELSSALEWVADASAAAANLIAGCVRVISLRRDHSQGWASASWPWFPGYMRLTNAHQRDQAWIIDGILHEAMHSLMSMIEVKEYWYTDGSPAGTHSETVRSPWTGRDLPLHSFLHACFVWYGLLCFWSMVEAEHTNMMLQRAARGFEGGHLMNAIRSLEVVDPYLLRLLEDLVAQAKQMIPRGVRV